MSMKTYFLFDSETGFILSGFDRCDDNQDDGYNIFTRPYKHPEYHDKKDKCRMDYLYRKAVEDGLRLLDKGNLKVGVFDDSELDQEIEWVPNPEYKWPLNNKPGWWRLLQDVATL